MARERMVTRTIEVVEATTLCVDVTTAETKTMVLELTGIGTVSPETMLKLLQKQYQTNNFKVVAITETFKREELYGMKEIDFLKSAVKLDPETRKRLEAED